MRPCKLLSRCLHATYRSVSFLTKHLISSMKRHLMFGYNAQLCLIAFASTAMRLQHYNMRKMMRSLIVISPVLHTYSSVSASLERAFGSPNMNVSSATHTRVQLVA